MRHGAFLQAVLTLSVACAGPPAVHVTVIPGSTVYSLTFIVHPSVPHQQIRGFRLAGSRLGRKGLGQSLWVVLATGGGLTTVPDTIRYGRCPPRFVATRTHAYDSSAPAVYELSRLSSSL